MLKQRGPWSPDAASRAAASNRLPAPRKGRAQQAAPAASLLLLCPGLCWHFCSSCRSLQVGPESGIRCMNCALTLAAASRTRFTPSPEAGYRAASAEKASPYGMPRSMQAAHFTPPRFGYHTVRFELFSYKSQVCLQVFGDVLRLLEFRE